MVPASFEQANVVLDNPPGMSVDDCEPLNVFRGPSADGKPVVISCWKVTPKELEEINRTGRIWLWIFGHTMFPAALDGLSPFNSAAAQDDQAGDDRVQRRDNGG